MTDVGNVVLAQLHHIRGAVDGLRDDMREVKDRLGFWKVSTPIRQTVWIVSTAELNGSSGALI